MDSSYSYNSSIENYMSRSTSNYKGDVSISEHLADFDKLRISALTKAAEISPLVNEVTIGPNSPIKKEEFINNTAVNDLKNEDICFNHQLKDDDLRYTLIMKKWEDKLQESSNALFKDFLDNMITKRAACMEKYWKRQHDDSKKRALDHARITHLVERLKNDNLSILEKAKLDEQKSQMINRQTLENMNRILEEQNKATARFAHITDSHTKICKSYNEITNLLNTEPLAKFACGKYIPSINNIIGNITAMMDLCNTGSVTDKDLKHAEMSASQMNDIRNNILKDLDDMIQEELNKKHREEEYTMKKELEEKKAQKVKAAEEANLQKAITEQAKKTAPLFYSPKNYTYYNHLKNFLTHYEAQYKELLEDVNMKKFRFDCQKAVNTPVNALSSVSGLHMKDKYDKLSKLLKGERVQVLDTYVTVSQHPQGLSYCTALLAKKIVRQGDLLVSSNPEAAFPLAALTLALWSQFPEFGLLLEAYFHKECPYLVPMFLPQKEGMSDKEFYMSRGYTYSEDGVVEKHDKFLKRMSGIFRLHCAIWIAKMPKFLNTQNPNGLLRGWEWLASFINLKPEPDICATLLHDFFNVCGSEFHKHYGKQFLKIIMLINIEYFAILQNIDEGGPKTRLEVFLQNILKTGYIEPPSGLLRRNTW